MGEALARAGVRAVGPLLPGHGTRPEDLELVSRGDLVGAARAALRELQGARRILVCGLSMGALLALHLAAEADPSLRIDALALLAPAIEFAGKSWLFTQVVGRLPRLPMKLLVSKGGRDIQARRVLGPQTANRAGGEDGAYSAVPVRWGRELRLLSEEALALAPRVQVPTLILHGARDQTAAPSGARRLAGALGGFDLTLHVYAKSGHVLPLDVDSEAVSAAVVGFFKKVEA